MTELDRLTEEIRSKYGDYLTQKEFMDISGISSRTAYLATKTGEVPYVIERVGKVRYYRIRAEHVARYMDSRSEGYKSEANPEKVRKLESILSKEPDVLRISQICNITGIHKNSVKKWIFRGYLSAFRCRGYYFVTKSELIRYMASPRYWNPHSKSAHRDDLGIAIGWNKQIYDKSDEAGKREKI